MEVTNIVVSDETVIAAEMTCATMRRVLWTTAEKGDKVEVEVDL
jgi:hypothetical protein